jgi:hypothetical protein
VLYPAMIVEFINLLLLKFFSGQQLLEKFLALLLPGLLVIFIHLFTAECARQLILRKHLTIAAALEVSLKRYLPLLFFSVLLPMLLLAPIILANSSAWLLALTLVPVSLVLNVYPVVYVLSNMPAYKVYQAIWQYFRRKPWQIWRIFLFLIAMTFSFNMPLVSLGNALPGNLASVVIPLLGGMRTVFQVYGLVLFFLGDQQVSELV